METVRIEVTMHRPEEWRLVNIQHGTAYIPTRLHPEGPWTWQVDQEYLITPNRPPR